MTKFSLHVGHVTDIHNNTGVTVFLPENPCACGWLLAGSAPATREVSLLDPSAAVDRIDALVFSGGSAFGLRTADGVMQWLKEENRGVHTVHGVVPIVPTACIYDFKQQSAIAPSVEDGYQACKLAYEDNLQMGLVGAATGASVGKLFPNAIPMTGGFGVAEITTKDNLCVRAYVVVNCVGDVLDKKGAILAGAKLKDNSFLNTAKCLHQGSEHEVDIYGVARNTTLVAIFTNAKFDRASLTRIAKMTTSGMARVISPGFTKYDGDAIFCCSIGDVKADEIQVGQLAAETCQQAIINAVGYHKTN